VALLTGIPHFGFPAMNMPPTKVSIKRKLACAACRIVRAEDGMRTRRWAGPLLSVHSPKLALNM
jgi:hypothetical protein